MSINYMNLNHQFNECKSHPLYILDRISKCPDICLGMIEPIYNTIVYNSLFYIMSYFLPHSYPYLFMNIYLDKKFHALKFHVPLKPITGILNSFAKTIMFQFPFYVNPVPLAKTTSNSTKTLVNVPSIKYATSSQVHTIFSHCSHF